MYYFSFKNRIPAQKRSHTIARFDRDWQSCREDEARAGALPYKPIQDVPFYDYVFKHKRLLFSRTMGYCSPYCFPIVL